MERLQKVMARAGVASRRTSEELIVAGRVSVNGQVVTLLGTQVTETDLIAVDGKPIGKTAPPLTYVLLNKPPGYVTTAHDPEGRPTVMDLVAGHKSQVAGRRPQATGGAGLDAWDLRLGTGDLRLFPVGRLDADSGGLLLLTNDGDLAYHLTHPKFALEKEYLVLVQGVPLPETLRRLRQGIELDGQMTAKAEVEVASPTSNIQRPVSDRRTQSAICNLQSEIANTWLRFIIHEGRKRQIRRMCLVVGHPAQRLIRVRVGTLSLGDLPVGKWRHLTPDEIRSLKSTGEILS